MPLPNCKLFIRLKLKDPGKNGIPGQLLNASSKRVVIPFRGFTRRARYKTRHSLKVARRKYSANALETAKGRIYIKRLGS